MSCESTRDSAKNPWHVAGYEKALTPDGAAVPLSIKSKEREGWEGRKKKKNKKGVHAVREKQKKNVGRRQVPRGGVGDRGARRRRSRKKDEGAPCCESVSDTPLRCCEHRLRTRSRSRSSSPSTLSLHSSERSYSNEQFQMHFFSHMLHLFSLSASATCCLSASLTH